MHFSKAFDYIHHDLMIVKVDADLMRKLYIYSYLENRKQYVKSNIINGNYIAVSSGVPHGSMVSLILCDVFFKVFFLCNVSIHYFSGNNLSGFVDNYRK